MIFQTSWSSLSLLVLLLEKMGGKSFQQIFVFEKKLILSWSSSFVESVMELNEN